VLRWGGDDFDLGELGREAASRSARTAVPGSAGEQELGRIFDGVGSGAEGAAAVGTVQPVVASQIDHVRRRVCAHEKPPGVVEFLSHVCRVFAKELESGWEDVSVRVWLEPSGTAAISGRRFI